MRRFAFAALVLGSTAACAALLDIGDLDVAPAVVCTLDGAHGVADECVAEGGVVVLEPGTLSAIDTVGTPTSGVAVVGTLVTDGGLRFVARSLALDGGVTTLRVEATQGDSRGAAAIQRGSELIAVGDGPPGGMLRVFPAAVPLGNVKPGSSPDFATVAGAKVGSVAAVRARSADSLDILGTTQKPDGGNGRFFVRRTGSDGGTKEVLLPVAGNDVTARFLLENFDGPTCPGCFDAVVLLGDSPTNGFVLARLDVGLGPDPAFRDGGVLATNLADGGRATSIDFDGKYYWVSGTVGGEAGFEIVRVTSAGEIDSTWGPLVLPGPQRGANQLEVDQGKLLLAGYADGKPAFARVDPASAALDPAFGNGGVLTFPYQGAIQSFVAAGSRLYGAGWVLVGGVKRAAVFWATR